MFDNTRNPFIEARNAGLSPIPVKKGSKVPAVTWKQFQTEICSELEAVEWGNGHHFGVGLVTGEVSGRLMAIDIEARFAGRLDELAAAMKVAGVDDIFQAWIDGYSEATPSGGLHILVRLEGEGRCPPNQVFAADSDGKPLIETRGEGGYVLVAPTVGYMLGRGGFGSIVYCTWEEWCGVAAVLAGFDETPSAPERTVATRSTVALDPILRFDSWVDDIIAGLPSMWTVLENHGFVFVRDDGKGPLFRHPTSTNDVSVRINLNGRLYVFSSSLPLPASSSQGDRTYDVVDVEYAYQHGHPPDIDERVDWLKAQRPPAERDAGARSTAVEPAIYNLPTEFWGQRGYLAHTRQAALSLRLSPDAVWAGVKCFYGATIPWNHRLPGDGTVDYIAIVVGASGAGKSQAKHAAWRLLESCHQIDGVYFPVPVGSGEGMTEVFVDRTDNSRRYKARGAGFYADEGKFLLDIGGRAGSTTIQAIKQMWSGELTGSVAATSERHRWLDPRAVRATLLISTTPDIAAAFMRQDLTDEGLPQRISWAWAHYDHPDQAPDWPGPLDVQVWDHNAAPDGLYEIDLADELAALIDTRRLAAAKGQVTDGFEGHATYATLKNAAIHAHLDARLNVTIDDWQLAQHEWEITRMVRRHILTTQHQSTIQRNTTIGRDRADQKIAEDTRILEKAVLSLHNKLTTENTLTNRQVRDHLRSFWKRHRIHHLDVINAVIARGWGVKTEQGINHHE